MCRSPISPPISQFWYYSSLGEISCSTSYAFLLNSFDTPLSRALIETTYADNGTRGNRPTRLGTCPGYHRRHTKTYKQQYRPPISQFPYYSSLGRNSLLYKLLRNMFFMAKCICVRGSLLFLLATVLVLLFWWEESPALRVTQQI